MKCFACPKELHTSEVIKCVACNGTYHFECLNMTSAYFLEHRLDLKKTWRCPSCENVTSRRKGTDTPVRQHFAPDSISHLDMSCDDSSAHAVGAAVDRPRPQTSDTNMHGIISYQQFAELLDSKLENMKACLSKEIRSQINLALENLKSDFTATTDFLSGQICDIDKEVKLYKSKFNDLECENQSLQKSIKQLQIELNHRDQADLVNDIQISGIPEFESESVVHVVSTVAAKIGVNIAGQDIVSAVRVGSKRAAAEASGAASFRSRPIVVRLARRALREEILKNARVRRGSSTGDLGLPPHEPRRVYINERLTKINSKIFVRARDAARAAGWRFVWTKEGRIYARRSEASEVHLLRTDNDVDKIFPGSESARVVT